MFEDNKQFERIGRLPPIGIVGVIALFIFIGVSEVWLLWNCIGVSAGVTLPITWFEAGLVTLFVGCTGALGRLLVRGLLQ